VDISGKARKNFAALVCGSPRNSSTGELWKIY